MNEELKNYFKNFILKDGPEWIENRQIEKMSFTHDLFLKQIDFFLQLSSINIAILGIISVFRDIKIDHFLAIYSGFFALINIILMISYSRFLIDDHVASVNKSIDKSIEDMKVYMLEMKESVKSNDFDLVLNYSKKRKEEYEKKTDDLNKNNFRNYSGEIFSCLFFISLFLLIFSVIKTQFNICLNDIIFIIGGIALSIICSFGDWSNRLINSLSKFIGNFKRWFIKTLFIAH